MARWERGTSAHAEHRAALARARYEKYTALYFALLDRADTRKSKAWRARDLREAERVRRLAEKADTDAALWDDRAAHLREQEEREERERQRKRRKKRYEYVLKVEYESKGRRGSRPKHHAVWWDVRLMKSDGSQATPAELEKAVIAIRGGTVATGWEVLSIAWDRGRRESWDDVPSREPRSAKQAQDALQQLSFTLGRREGVDYVVEPTQDTLDWQVGEEEFDEE